MIIHIFLIVIILVQVTPQQNLQRYDNGNYGTGLNNQVNGANNIWNGAQNTINGNENKVKGDQNKIKGNNNVVQGSNNVIGDVSPQQIARMQNEMAQKLRSRFSGLGIFGTPTVSNNLSSQTSTVNQNNVPTSSNQEKKLQAKKQQTKPQQNVQSKSKQVTNNNDAQKNESIKKVEQNLQQVVIESVKRIFRIYGQDFTKNMIPDWFNQKYDSNQIAESIFKRFNKDLLKQRRIFFSSLFKPPTSIL